MLSQTFRERGQDDNNRKDIQRTGPPCGGRKDIKFKYVIRFLQDEVNCSLRIDHRCESEYEWLIVLKNRLKTNGYIFEFPEFPCDLPVT